MIEQGKHRMQIHVQGAVQGVGFRPFVYRLAHEMGLTGWVNNSTQGVLIEVEGPRLDQFLQRLHAEYPAHAHVQHIETLMLAPIGYTAFEIHHSDSNGNKTVLVLPDIATCPDCLHEIFDPQNRRYRYPFTNCTHCGPRFTIIEALPYDRPNTSMKHFPMCPSCQAEYENPLDRRFHAQPNACPECGPSLSLWDIDGNVLLHHDEALSEAANAIRAGNIVAVKGLGGFHLMVDARNERAIQRLRQRKHRPDKALALMYPSLEMVKYHCRVEAAEERLLDSSESPIVLVKRTNAAVADNVAPNNPHLGVMLPYTPLHHLLMADLGFPIVATSANLSDEPICTDEYEALGRLKDIADLFLVHNRPIVRHIDDSIGRVVAGQTMLLRRARGYAPLPVQTKTPLPALVAVGGHLKNTVAVSVGKNIFLSQHIGDLETAQSLAAFEKIQADFMQLYDLHPEAIACDLHPDYQSTKFAETINLPRVSVQHHYAHVLAGMAEHQLEAPLLGVAWDGTGYGTDGTIWGGEFLHIDSKSFTRIAYFRPFPLPGGEQAVKEPRRIALGLLHEINTTLELPFSPQELIILKQMLHKKINVAYTSSVGRLFDAIASLIGLIHEVSFEGQAAMALEFAIQPTEASYPFELVPQGNSLMIDWEPLVTALLAEQVSPLAPAKFHNTLVKMILAIARWSGEKRVVLTGGCFQNRYLLEQSIQQLQAENFEVYWPRHIPPNDGGIALGQIIAATRES